MIPIKPTNRRAWKNLRQHFHQLRDIRMTELFGKDQKRFEKFSLRVGDIFLDYSKNILTEKTLSLLMELAEEMDLEGAIHAMFSGEKVNQTENRAVLHAALRNMSDKPVICGGFDVMVPIREELARMKDFSEKVRTGRMRGFTGKAITDIVNIGIGGSDLGPAMVGDALSHYSARDIQVHFVSNADASDLIRTLQGLRAETTFFLICSKSFKTPETLANARSAREWFLASALGPDSINKHFGAISTNISATGQFGIDKNNVFSLWDFVGGRFSIWSAIGISTACLIGFDQFMQFLRGAYEMDLHFRMAPFNQNLPVLLALIGIWYNNFFETETEAIFSYDYCLRKLPAYLQQAHMESNGKSVDREGEPVNYPTSPIFWGELGINGQHAFFQLLHQGTRMVPATFIGPAVPLHHKSTHHRLVLSNMIAQTEALMKGKNRREVRRELEKKGLAEEEIRRVLPFRVFEGNRPSNTILYKKLTPKTLGALIAMYEHKIFVQGHIWNIFSFDQWGVQLGKQLAVEIERELESDDKSKSEHDSSTAGLIRMIGQMQGEND